MPRGANILGEIAPIQLKYTMFMFPHHIQQVLDPLACGSHRGIVHESAMKLHGRMLIL